MEVGYRTRLGVALLGSVVAHALTGDGLSRLPAQPPMQRPQVVKMEIVKPAPPPPAPEPEPEPAPPPPPKDVPLPLDRVVHDPNVKPPKNRPQRLEVGQKEAPPKDLPRSERAVTTGPTTDVPTFGFSLESTSESGKGAPMPVGNTLQTGAKGPPQPPKSVKPLAPPPPVAAYEVTKMPVVRDRDACRAKYPDAARDAGVEGTVVLDLIVDETGAAREIHVVKGLGHGLDEAAVQALRRCKFTPGERGGKPVPVRIRTFKMRFFAQEEE